MNRARAAAERCNFLVGLTLLALLSTRALAGTGPITLPNPTPSARIHFGNTLALSPDGSVAVVTSINNGGAAVPAVYLFQYANGAWSPTPIISLPDPVSAVVPNDGFGAAVAVSAISNNSVFLAVGAPVSGVVNLTPVSYGVVYLFQCTLNAPAGCTLLALITDPAASPASGDEFGSALAISQNGNTLLVGAWGTPGPGGAGVSNAPEPQVGAAYVYTATGGSWPQSPTVTAALSEYAPTCAKFSQTLGTGVDCDEFGFAVALSSDGTQALVGAPGAVVNSNPYEGSAFAFQVYSGQWQTTPVTTLYNADGTACTNLAAGTCDLYGFAVALSADGSTAVVGAPNALGNGLAAGELGAVNVFHQLVAGTWGGVTSPVFVYTNPNQASEIAAFAAQQTVQGYGTALALSNNGTTLLVGSSQAEELPLYPTTSNGVIDSYTCNFSSSPNCVNTPAQILDPQISVGNEDAFGASVAMSTDATVVLAGAPNTPSSGSSESGTAYLYGAPGAQAALSLALSVAPNPVAPTAHFTYQFTAANTSNLFSAIALTLTETLPAGVTYVSNNAAGGACTVAGGTFTCTLATLAPGATWQPSITVFASGPPAAIHASGTLTAGTATAKAFVTSVMDVPPTANNGQLGVTGGAATSGTLSATPGLLAALTYSLVTQPAHGTVVLTNAGTGAFTYTPTSGYIGSDSFTFDVSDGLWTSSAATENVVVATSTVALALSYTGPNNVTVVPNQELVYGLTVTNTDKQQPAVNVVLSGTLVAGVKLISDTAAGATCTATAATYTCMLASLAAGATWTASVTVQMGSVVTRQSVTAAMVSVKAQNSNNNPSISASVSEKQNPTTLYLSYSNLSLLCTPSSPGVTGNCPTVTPGSIYRYAIAVTNSAGSATADNVLVTVSIPPGMTFSYVSAGSGICLIDAAEGKMACALTTLAPQTGGPISVMNPQDWLISFAATVNSTDTSGQVLTSQASASASNTGATPDATTTVVVGTPLNGGGGGLGWLDILALSGFAWFGRRKHLARFHAIGQRLPYF